MVATHSVLDAGRHHNRLDLLSRCHNLFDSLIQVFADTTVFQCLEVGEF